LSDVRVYYQIEFWVTKKSIWNGMPPKKWDTPEDARKALESDPFWHSRSHLKTRVVKVTEIREEVVDPESGIETED
jgi:hypothetical protein